MTKEEKDWEKNMGGEISENNRETYEELDNELKKLKNNVDRRWGKGDV